MRKETKIRLRTAELNMMLYKRQETQITTTIKGGDLLITLNRANRGGRQAI